MISRPFFTPAEFALRRVFRLYPVWLVILGAALLAREAGYRISGMSEPYSWQYLIQSMLFIPQQRGPLYDVTWSLEHEIVFYFIAGLVATLCQVRYRATAPAAVLFCLVLIRPLYEHLGGGWDYHIIVAPQSDFLAGVITFLTLPYLTRIPVVFLLSIGVLGHYLTHGLNIPYMGSVGSVFLLAAFVGAHNRYTRWAAKLGDASYSLYLSHWLILYMAILVSMPLIYKVHPEIWRWTVLLFCCVVSLLLWRWIEKPLIDWSHRLTRARTPHPVSLSATARAD